MSWAARRRAMILFIVGAVSISFISVVSIATFYQAPSCSDNTQNQGETGIDCGGPCAFLCTAQQQPPTVLFTKALNNGTGRTDVVAMIENKNTLASAVKVPFSVMLYGSGQVLLQQVSGTVDFPPGGTVPVFIPGVFSGAQSVSNAFLTIDGSAIKWMNTNQSNSVPVVAGTNQTGTTNAPRIEALLMNQSPLPMRDITAVILVRDATKEVIAASKTIVPLIPAQSTSQAIFTWNAPFSAIPASIEVIPVVSSQ